MIDRALPSPRQAWLRRGLFLEYLTVGWNVIEGILAVGAGILAVGAGIFAVGAGMLARSPSLVGFGVDSAVESTSGGVLIWRLRGELHGDGDEKAFEALERRAERIVGFSFLLLAAYVAFDAVTSLLNQDRPAVSPLGIVVAAVSIAAMLWLARAKRTAGTALGSRALLADAKQTQACWYLSFTTLAGLGLNALFGIWWADPVAAMVIVAFLVREGFEALRGDHEEG